MNFETFLFAVLPYLAIGLMITVTILRWRRHPFSVSSLSSQLLESRRLYWGSISFHWGLVLILLGHLAALIVPSGFELWNRVPVTAVSARGDRVGPRSVDGVRPGRAAGPTDPSSPNPGGHQPDGCGGVVAVGRAGG